MWLFPWLSWAVVAGICVVLILMASKPDLRNQLMWSAVSVVVVAIAYVIRQRMAPATALPQRARVQRPR
jgi:L-asparagine transporter-like permease